MNKKEKELKSIELFAGAGGLALGLEMAGFNHIGLVEFNESAVQTLRANRPEWNVLFEDVEQVASRDLEKEFNIKKGELDLLSGGAPCQSFSYAGKRLGLEDVRGTMFYHYATFLRKLQPKMFLFENVRGLLSHDHGRTFQTILNIFEDCGYDTSYKVLNAWDYGNPQKRERLITVGIRNDLKEKIKYSFPMPHDYKPVMKDVKLEQNPSKENCEYYSDYKKSFFELVPPGGCWRDIPEEKAKEWMKKSWYLGLIKEKIVSINYVQRIYTGENNRTEYDEIYVFTSYLVGAHEGGAALLVYRKFRAVQQCNCATRDR